VSSAAEEAFDLVPAHLAVQAMRDNGYRNAAYAAAELIDNSIQAGADSVELIALEDTEFVQQRTRARIKEIAVLDNGCGMNSTLLRQALQFGNGSHLNDRSGIGRFGMGLPSASISQCLHVDVWSWQDGPESAQYTYIDVNEVSNRLMREVPTPRQLALPEKWRSMGRTWGRSGTLVVWSGLDRIMWRTGKALMDNSEFLVARMYRRFLVEGAVRIRMATYEKGAKSPKHEWFAEPNDPGYLMVPSSTPAPYDVTAMFQPDGDAAEVPQIVEFNGEQHEVLIRLSYAKEEARTVRNAGATDYGRHAGKNIGVSLMRADRELDMDQAFVSTSEARDRWWGVEVDFPPALDELFGVANNKQTARNFSELASRYESYKTGSGDWHAFRDELTAENDPRGPLLEIIDLIDRRVRGLREMIKLQNVGADTARKRHSSSSAEAAATAATKERQDRGNVGQSDAEEALDPALKAEQIREELVESGLTDEQARELAARTVDNGLKYLFTPAQLEGRAFFTVSPKAGDIIIKVNTSHPAYDNLVEVLEREIDENATPDELRTRLERAGKGLKLLLMAWARYEDEQPSDESRAETQDVRAAWGMMAYKFLQDR
jgi:hypothetical protein